MAWGKILRSFFEEDKGYTYVEYETKYGLISVEAQCHPDDMDIKNCWDGFQICDLRAYLEFERLDMIALRERYLATEHLLNVFAWNYDIDVVDALNRQSQVAFRLYREARERYIRHRRNIGTTIKNIVKQRRIIREQFDNI